MTPKQPCFSSVSAGKNHTEKGFLFHSLISKDSSGRSPLKHLPCQQQRDQDLYATQLNHANLCSDQEALQLALI